MRRLRPEPGKAARNERRKLRATTLNAIALALLAIGVIQPAFAGRFDHVGLIRMAFSAFGSYFVHEVAAAAEQLGGLR